MDLFNDFFIKTFMPSEDSKDIISIKRIIELYHEVYPESDTLTHKQVKDAVNEIKNTINEFHIIHIGICTSGIYRNHQSVFGIKIVKTDDDSFIYKEFQKTEEKYRILLEKNKLLMEENNLLRKMVTNMTNRLIHLNDIIPPFPQKDI